MDILTTVLLGVGTVFFGLVCLVLMIKGMHALISAAAAKKENKMQTVTLQKNEPEIDRNILVAIAGAVIAEQSGKDISALKICSIKKAS